MQKNTKENASNPVVDFKTNRFQQVPQVLFNFFLDFLGIRANALLISRIYYDWSQSYWKNRIASDFEVIPDYKSPHLLTPFIIYRHLSILSKMDEYRIGTRWGDPLNPAYIKSQLSQEELEIYGPEKSFSWAVLVGNGPLIAWLLDRNRGRDRQKPTWEFLTYVIKKRYQELTKLLVISAADEKYLLNTALLNRVIAQGYKDLRQLILPKVMPNSVQVQIVKILLAHKIQPNRDTLNHAVKSRNLKLVKLILPKVQPDKDILDRAARTGCVDIVKLIMNQEEIVPDGETLKDAILSGSLELAKFILQSNEGGIPLSLPSNGMLGLYLSHHNLGYKVSPAAVINYLLVNGRIIFDDAILNVAVLSGDLELTKLILSKDVRPNENTFYLAAGSGRGDMVDLMRNYGPVLDREILRGAANSGNLELFKRILSKGVKPDNVTLFAAIRSFDEQILKTAALSSRLEIVKLILSEGVTPDRSNLSTIFSSNPNPDLVNLIIDRGMIPDLEALKHIIYRLDALEAVKLMKKMIEEKNMTFNMEILKQLITSAAGFGYHYRPQLVEFLLSKFQPKDQDLLSFINLMMERSVHSAFIENQIRLYFPRLQLEAFSIQEIFTSATRYRYPRIIELMMDINQTLQPVCFTENILNQIAGMGEESLVQSVLESKLQPDIYTITSAINSGNRRLTKWLIQICLQNYSENDFSNLVEYGLAPHVIDKNMFWLMQWMMSFPGEYIVSREIFLLPALAAGYQDMVMWLTAEERGPKRVKLNNDHLGMAGLFSRNSEFIIWLKKQLSSSGLFLSFSLFVNIASFLVKSEQSTLARTSKKAYKWCNDFQGMLTLTAPRAADSSNTSTARVAAGRL